MANESPRLSTADLRRRLHTTGAPPVAAPAEDDQESAPAEPYKPARRMTIPASVADLPLAEDEATFPIPHGAPPVDSSLVDLAGLPSVPTHVTPPELRRVPTARPAPPSFAPSPAPAYSPPPAPAYAPQSAPTYSPPASPAAAAHPSFIREDPIIEQLKQENAQLHQLMEEMRQLLQDASEQEQRVQAELKDREAKLATSASRIEELEAIVNAKPKSKGELEEWADELERESFQIAQERRLMDTDRKQLREDESALEKQMREMEVQMARERAMLARQEQELKRLNAEIQHELEIMQRGDGTLRERLAVFQRRHAEVIGGPPPPPAQYYGHQQVPVAQVATATPPPRKSDSNGILRKLFRGGE